VEAVAELDLRGLSVVVVDQGPGVVQQQLVGTLPKWRNVSSRRCSDADWRSCTNTPT